MGRGTAGARRLLFEEQGAESPHSPGAAWMPAVDIVEEKEHYLLIAELPGMDQADIDVRITGGLLTLRGERAGDPPSRGRAYHRMERPEGLFHRTFRLPGEVDPEKVQAVYRDGVLRVTLPKRGWCRVPASAFGEILCRGLARLLAVLPRTVCVALARLLLVFRQNTVPEGKANPLSACDRVQPLPRVPSD